MAVINGRRSEFEFRVMPMDEDNVSKLPTAQDRDFFRVEGVVYLHYETIDINQGHKKESYGFHLPTFEMESDDFVGLSIDAFREKVQEDSPEGKDYFLQMQQLLAMMKRFVDATLSGRRQKLFNRTTVNISGSGVAFLVDHPMAMGTTVRLSLFFPRHPFSYVCVMGNIVKSEKNDEGYLIKVQFEEMSEKTEEEIVKFVNQCQRDTIRK